MRTGTSTISRWLDRAQITRALGPAAAGVGRLQQLQVLQQQTENSQELLKTLNETMMAIWDTASERLKELRDADRRIGRLIAATPISHVGYAFSRFTASVAVIALIMSAWMIVQVVCHEFLPIDSNTTTSSSATLS